MIPLLVYALYKKSREAKYLLILVSAFSTTFEASGVAIVARQHLTHNYKTCIAVKTSSKAMALFMCSITTVLLFKLPANKPLEVLVQGPVIL